MLNHHHHHHHHQPSQPLLRRKRARHASAQTLFTDLSKNISSSSSSPVFTTSTSTMRAYTPAKHPKHANGQEASDDDDDADTMHEADTRSMAVSADGSDAALSASTTRETLVAALSALSTGFLCISFPLHPCTDRTPLLHHPNDVVDQRATGLGVSATPALFDTLGISADEDLSTLRWIDRCVHPDDRGKLVDFIFDKSIPVGDGSITQGRGRGASYDATTKKDTAPSPSSTTAPPPPANPVEPNVPALLSLTAAHPGAIALIRAYRASSTVQGADRETFIAAVRSVRREWDGSRGHLVSTFAVLPLETFGEGVAAAPVAPAPTTTPARGGGHGVSPTPLPWAAHLDPTAVVGYAGDAAGAPALTPRMATLLRAAVESPARAVEDAHRACRESERFAKVIGRELRHPLTGLMGCVGLLEQSLSERGRVYSLLESAFFRASRAVGSAAAFVEAETAAAAAGEEEEDVYPSPGLEPGQAGFAGLGFEEATEGFFGEVDAEGEYLPPAAFEDEGMVTGVSELALRHAKRARMDAMDAVPDAIRAPPALVDTLRTYLEEDILSLAAIAECVDRSRSVIDDVLDLSRMEARRVRLFPRRIDAKRVVTDVARRLAPRAQDRGTSLRLNLPVDDVWILADPVRFDQAVANLVAFSISRCGAGAAAAGTQGYPLCPYHFRQSLIARGAGGFGAMQGLHVRRPSSAGSDRSSGDRPPSCYLDEDGNSASIPGGGRRMNMPGMSETTTMNRPPADEASMSGTTAGNDDPTYPADFCMWCEPPPASRVVTLGLDAALSADGSLWVTVTSLDNGLTLTPAEQAGLFDRSAIVRNHPPPTAGAEVFPTAASFEDDMQDVGGDASPGVGEGRSIGPALGLLVSKRLAEIMGGSVVATPGPPARFRAVFGGAGLAAGGGGAEDEGVVDGGVGSDAAGPPSPALSASSAAGVGAVEMAPPA
ncbi:hypothetical protein HDU96_002433, partial [Phlyctochytrium bullatum]